MAMRERMTAIRASVADIINGTYGSENGPHVISPLGVELRRVMLVGHIVDQYAKQGNFASITIDDGTETIRAKAWGAESASLETISCDIIALVIGKVREYQDEIYIVPEIIREIPDSNYITLHLMERYRTVLTRSGLSMEESSELEQSLSDGSSTQETLSESTPSVSHDDIIPVKGIAAKILKFIKEKGVSGAVHIDDITSAFTSKKHSKSDIQLKIIDLQDKEKIREVELGLYMPSDM